MNGEREFWRGKDDRDRPWVFHNPGTVVWTALHRFLHSRRISTKTANRLIPAVIALAINISAATVQAEDYSYETNNGTITITKYTGPGGVVTIPGTING